MKKVFLSVAILCTALISLAQAEENDLSQLQGHREVFKRLIAYEEYNTEKDSSWFSGAYDLFYEDIYQMETYELTDEMWYFLYACTYLSEALDSDTYGYAIGTKALEALEALENGYVEVFRELMDTSHQYYEETPENNKMQEDIIIETGIYIIGEDIPTGKYDIAAINGSGGSVYIYNNYDAYKSGNHPDSYYFLYAEDYKYYEQGDSSIANNIRLEEDECIKVDSGLELSFTAK